MNGSEPMRDTDLALGLGPAGMGSCPLVLGECVQGRLRGGPHFLITAPIQQFSQARYQPRPDLDSTVVTPPGSWFGVSNA